MQAPVSDEGLNDTAICKKGPLSPISYLQESKFFFFWNVHQNQHITAEVMSPSEDPNLLKNYLLEKFLTSYRGIITSSGMNTRRDKVKSQKNVASLIIFTCKEEWLL